MGDMQRLQTEKLLLSDYIEWTRDMRHFAEDSAGREFCEGLVNDLDQEIAILDDESKNAFKGASSLGLWEWRHFDQDGGTKGIQAWSAKQWNDNLWTCREAYVKYGHLAPPGYAPRLYSDELEAYTKLYGTPCDYYVNIILPDQEQQHTALSDNNLHSTINSPSPSNQLITTGEQEDDRKDAEEQQPSPSPSSASPVEDDVPINYEDYAWYSGV